jgi:hypothetical protein
MYNMEDILARLRNGEDADAIATELTNAMNGALEAHKAEVAAKEAEAARAKAEAEALEEEKLDYFVDIVDSVIDFVKTYYVKSDEMMDFVDDFVSELDYKLLLAALDKTVNDAQKDPVVQLSLELLKNEAKNSKVKATGSIMPKPIAKTKTKALDKEEFDAVMADFFKNFGI